MYSISNRRYIGNKNKLMPWISDLVHKHCKGDTFFDVFAGSGSVSNYFFNDYNEFILNDFLYSNEVIYKAFFGVGEYRQNTLDYYKNYFNDIDKNKLEENYVSVNYGNKFFNNNDAKLIGYIRSYIDDLKLKKDINEKEFNILLASLLYSMDKVANTVGHYDAYRKIKDIKEVFCYNLIDPIDTKNKTIHIYREDANTLVRNVKADIAFIDPPYNSRQYSRFYHVLENITKWEKPELYGVAMKPEEENMSDYCKTKAYEAFKDLIENIQADYVVVTYNNTYNSKSSSSKNKIEYNQIVSVLESQGETKIFEQSYKAFNTGKTELPKHKEFLFIMKKNKSKKSEDNSVIRSPLFYVGDKYKLMKQLNGLFPDEIDTYVEPFVGGGSSFLNTEASKYYLNDINPYVIDLHKELQKYKNNFFELIDKLYLIIDEYGLSCSYRGINVPDSLKKQYVKTYYSVYNKNAYNRLKKDYNKDKDILKLYVLLIYGFNHMIRFNRAGEFNLPVGNVDFNANVYKALKDYVNLSSRNNYIFFNKDFREFLNNVCIDKNTFVYCDPPYLISNSEYNKNWREDEEIELCRVLDELNEKNVYFGITNLINHKGVQNTIFKDWSKKYKVYNIESNYISFNDNTIKADSKEVYVTNYGTRK